MANDLCISIIDYLQSKTGFNEENFRIIRESYKRECGEQFSSLANESALKTVINQLKINTNDDQHMTLLRDCILLQDEDDCRVIVKDTIQRMTTITSIKSNSSLATTNTMNHYTNDSSIPTVNDKIPALADIDCLLSIKMAFSDVAEFIQSFLLKPIDDSSNNQSSSNLMNDREVFLLNVQCPLYLFILQKIPKSRIITSSNSTGFHLIEPTLEKDSFSQWEYDHLHGLFDLTLVPHSRDGSFPTRWRLDNNVSIYCRIKIMNSNKNWTSFLSCDQPTTAVDLSQKRQQIMDDPKNTDNKDKHVPSSLTDNSTLSKSELYAGLHLIKLLFWYTLCDHPVVKRVGKLAKIDSRCLELAFEEILAEGFADDVLFPRMKEFFLPFTISEEELVLRWSSNRSIERTWSKQRDELLKDRQELQTKLNIERTHWQEYNTEIHTLNQRMKKDKEQYLVIEQELNSIKYDRRSGRSMVGHLFERTFKSGIKKSKEEYLALEKSYQKSKNNIDTLDQMLKEYKQKENDAYEKKQQLESQIDAKNVSLSSIETKLSTPPRPVDKTLIKPPRGVILYGPPGTGKSEILRKLAKKLGIVLVSQPLAAGELNRSLVGETERLLLDLGTRCNHIPYGMCGISIDEIDSLAPKRGKDSTEGKIDKISVLLSLIEGVRDVPNLMIFSATNRLHMMDEAFLRRMSGKFFVGRPSSSVRISMLQNIPFWALDAELLGRLSSATTNFSGAAVKELTRAITVKCVKMNLTEPLSELEALKLVDRVAQHYQIFIGSETLPRLFIRNLHAELRRSIDPLSSNLKYTGRMIVDLHNQYIRMEVMTQIAKSNDYSLSVDERALCPNETSVQNLLERLTDYGKNLNVQLLQLVDLNLLTSQGAYDEQKVYETLKDRYDECVSYKRSMIVYDLDALVGINKSENSSNMGRATSYAVNNQSIFAYVLARFRDRAMEDNEDDKTDNVERWSVVVIREPFLLRQFAEAAQFPHTLRQEKELDAERHLAEDLLKCVKCNDFYIAMENRMGSCVHHDGFVYDITTAELDVYTPNDAMKFLIKLDCKPIKNPEERDTIERQRKKFKWICCDETFSNVYKGGCKKGKHAFVVKDHQSSIRGQSGTIEQWEDACLANKEYNKKLLGLKTYEH